MLYKSSGHYKYAYTILLHLVKISALDSEDQADVIKWNRFFNKEGGPGKNISLDLKKEQQNKVLKTFWRSLGANLRESSASRIAEALQSFETILESN